MQQRITNTLIHKKKKKIQESGDLFIALNCPEPWFVSLFSFITKSLKASAFLTLKWDYYSSRPLRLLCRLNEMIPVFGTIISSNTYYLSLCFFYIIFTGCFLPLWVCSTVYYVWIPSLPPFTCRTTPPDLQVSFICDIFPAILEELIPSSFVLYSHLYYSTYFVL